MSEAMYAILSKYSDAWENKGRKEGRKEGLSQGATQKALSMAQAMLCDGMEKAVVARYTGLSMDEVAALQAE